MNEYVVTNREVSEWARTPEEIGCPEEVEAVNRAGV